MKTTILIAVIFMAALTGSQAAPAVGNSPFENPSLNIPANQIDKAVFSRLSSLGIEPAAPCSDAVFVRRVYLDVIGTLPAMQEARNFILDSNPDKRRVLIDRLMERDEFADYWAMKWSDLLRIKAEFPIKLWPNAAQAYHRWVRTSIRDNMPYDRFVKELLTASGSNFRVPQVNFYRAVQNKEPGSIAQTVALTFMGTRTDNWPKEKLNGMAGFFSKLSYKETSEWKEEIVFFDAGKTNAFATNGLAPVAVFPDGTVARLKPEEDPRQAFANWLIDAKNPWFAKNIVNRIWSWLMGRGIINEADDIRPDNPPSNPALLALLEKELVDSHYDMKKIFRLILNSKTYQLSSIAKSTRPEAEANFASYSMRRLEAEVLADALCQITGTTETYSSLIPEPYTFIPLDVRSIALPDGSITSSFLELFGRPARDTGYEGERNNKPTAFQRLHMLNSSHVQQKLDQSKKFQSLLQSSTVPREVLSNIYLTILSRYPTPHELLTMGEYTRTTGLKGREVAQDLAWALINSSEFLYRH